ncbi:hypothetical protein JQ557_33585 [Bradyrhizobium sp. U87765 SZCCT0131]|uniref:hypothetical protein n=1 Tax=unclassified Bradyrhizobium TaxID=2631580 RepID=UPI001BAA182E|nr:MULTISPECIES: hypothetical protein [unclassified Bradyrhizobium]MBR1222974.1 hypothetical protein [Bradyrhizobium sp. U87765 SZCCT0131]MBR1262710.1 hypothetical protein [Bradyrhizobium sp. U87765 SZCCT0134]MBR1308818.1 hypothetical protein [Bradyrhizobium sp. U87765 SZCCT0110]MBR1318492.1 hypothetical protein [Bradyrhizobium sp. U87765 SZCCT0109]MBR1352196.1 hypothetical protein [Bradyrhizobium sp. U87765 SZCCT0048]
MRKTIMGLAAAVAVSVAGAAPAMACGGDYYVSPCSGGLFTSGFGYQAGYGGYQTERLPEPHYSYGPRYYYVNQGPVYSGPGNYGPVPTYQERAVTGWRSYDRPYYYGYNGGPYGDATSHYYDGMPAVRGPVVYRYHRNAYRHGYRHTMRYGYHTHRQYARGPRVIRVPNY